MTKFQKLILIKLLRSDALMTAVYHFVYEILGPKFLDSGIFCKKEKLSYTNPRGEIWSVPYYNSFPGGEYCLSHSAKTYSSD